MGKVQLVAMAGVVCALWAWAAPPARAQEVQLTVKTAQATSLHEVAVCVGSIQAGTTGANATDGVVLDLELSPGSHTLVTTFRDFVFTLDSDGSISAASDSHLSVSGSTITILNDLDFEDFAVRMRNPTGLTKITLQAEVVHSAMAGWNYYTRVGTLAVLTGADADDAPASIEMTGLVPGMTLGFRGNHGSSILFQIDEGGDLGSSPDSIVSVAFDGSNPQCAVIENGIHVTGFGVRTSKATSLDTVTYMFGDFYGPGHFAPTSESSGNLTMPAAYVSRSGSTAHSDLAEFDLTGLVPGQQFLLRSTWGTDWFYVTASGAIQRSTTGIPVTVSGEVLVIDNTIDVADFRVCMENPINAGSCTFRGAIYPHPGRWTSPDANLTTTGTAATSGVSMPLTGVIAGLPLYCESDVTLCYFQVTADGSVEPKGPWGPNEPGYWEDGTVASDADGVTLKLLNTQELWVKLYTSNTPPSSMAGVSYHLRIGGVSVDDSPRLGEPASDLATGQVIHVKYAGPHSVLSAAIVVSPASGSGASPTTGHQTIRLRPNGEATFTDGYYGPVVNDSPVRGALPVTIGGVANVFYVEFVDPPNLPPTVRLEDGDNLTIASSAQPDTTLTATVADPDGDGLTCSWTVDGAAAAGEATPAGNGECTLDLGDLDDLGVGTHTVRIQVSDGLLTAAAELQLTIDNSPPDLAVGAGGGWEYGADVDVEVAAEVGDYDGDSLTYTWRWGGQQLAAGWLYPEAGGEPVAVPALVWPTTLLGTGTHVLTLEVDDGENDPVMKQVLVEVLDTTAPTMSPTASRLLLWPPNHEMVEVAIDTHVQDASGTGVTLAVTVESSDPPEYDDDGNLLPDHEVTSVDATTGEITLDLRAERAGKGDGRAYRVTITATDASGNATTSTVEFVCPHDRRK